VRDAYGEALIQLGRHDENVVVLDADVGSSCKSAAFGREFPGRYFNVGIAEANMVALAAGLASRGRIPFANTFAAFMMLRAGDPVRSLIAYTGLNVKLAGAYAGLSDSYDGASHQAITDVAFVRALPNVSVVSVADAVETAAATTAIAQHRGPVYLRLGRADLPVIFDEATYVFELGKGIRLTDGGDVTIVAKGYMVTKSLAATDLLRRKEIEARVVNLHTIKPLDEDLLVDCARETGTIVTVEEHSVLGGLGSAVVAVLARRCLTPIERIGICDTFAESGEYEALLTKHGLSEEKIMERTEAAITRKEK
jgi:transketolase